MRKQPFRLRIAPMDRATRRKSWARSSVGRASRLQREGHGFKSRRVHLWIRVRTHPHLHPWSIPWMWERLDAPTDNLGLDHTICMGVSEADIHSECRAYAVWIKQKVDFTGRKLTTARWSVNPGPRTFERGSAISVRLLQPRWGITRLRSR